MKKLLVVLIATGAAFAAWRQVQSGKSSQEKLWAEATDKVA